MPRYGALQNLRVLMIEAAEINERLKKCKSRVVVFSRRGSAVAKMLR
jgi:hypothetical protein